MADFVSVLRRAVGNLDNNTEAARQAIYGKARTALRAQLEAIEPPLSEEEITLQTDALDRAVGVVEADFAPNEPGPAGAVEELPGEAAAPREAPVASPPPASSPAPIAAAGPASVAPAASARPHQSFQDAVAETGTLGTATSAAARQARDTLDRIGPHDAGGTDDETDGYPAARLEPTIPAPPPPRSGRPSAPAGAPARPPAARAAAPAQIYDEDDGPERGGSGRVVAWIILFLVLAGIAGVGFWQRDTVMEVVASLRDEDGTADVADNGKIADRVPGSPGQTGDAAPQGDTPTAAASPPPASVTPVQPAPAAPPPSAEAEGARPAQALLIEENPGGVTPASTLGGSVDWKLVDDTEAIGGVEKVIRGDVTVPEKGLALTFTVRRNSDAALPASHLIELVFTTDGSFEHGGVASIPGIIMKATPRSTGQPLVGAVVPVMDSYFLVGLSESELDRVRNVEELKARDFIDVPISYKDGGRAVLSLAKGESGKDVFDEAFAAWQQ